ncbi:unnamed protein product, partial [Iphiclides podalirius]
MWQSPQSPPPPSERRHGGGYLKLWRDDQSGDICEAGGRSLHPFCSRERATLGGREESARRHSRRLVRHGRVSVPLLSATYDRPEPSRH